MGEYILALKIQYKNLLVVNNVADYIKDILISGGFNMEKHIEIIRLDEEFCVLFVQTTYD